MSFETIQKEMVAWQEHNFPGRESWVPLMGLGEELGELAQATTDEEIEDAIGDCCIYLADYCNAMNLSLTELYFALTELYFAFRIRKKCDFRGAMAIYGQICHGHLKLHQKIRMHESHIETIKENITSILLFLDTFTLRALPVLAEETWQKVKQRDWQKNRNTAHEDVK